MVMWGSDGGHHGGAVIIGFLLCVRQFFILRGGMCTKMRREDSPLLHFSWLKRLFKLVPYGCTTIHIEVEGVDNAPVIIRHLSICITTVTVIKLIITNSLNLVHTKK